MLLLINFNQIIIRTKIILFLILDFYKIQKLILFFILEFINKQIFMGNLTNLCCCEALGKDNNPDTDGEDDLEFSFTHEILSSKRGRTRK